MIPRFRTKDIERSLRQNPVTAILGPRQCGKTTIAKEIMEKHNQGTIYLDIERPSDLRKLDQAEWFLESQSDKLIVIDEIQRKPELFPLLRSLTDEKGTNGQYLILGSASRDLLQQSSETLAGRIRYAELSPFTWNEVEENTSLRIEDYLDRGGFPRSILAEDSEASFDWRINFITTFLERDLLQFEGFPPETMRRLWKMIAHNNGQTINLSRFGGSLGISHTTVRRYIDLLKSAFMLHVVSPLETNMKKRLVKSPKVYVCDCGLTNALLDLHGFDHITGHSVFGSLWESVVLSELRLRFPKAEISFMRTSNGSEIDFILTYGQKTVAIECKAGKSPSLNRGNYSVLRSLQPDSTFVVIPESTKYLLKENIFAVGLTELCKDLETLLKK